MTINTLSRRLSKLAGGTMSTEAINKQINKAIADGRARAQAWSRTGNAGPMPFHPLREPSSDATRAEREQYETLKAARARAERYREHLETEVAL